MRKKEGSTDLERMGRQKGNSRKYWDPPTGIRSHQLAGRRELDVQPIGRTPAGPGKMMKERNGVEERDS